MFGSWQCMGSMMTNEIVMYIDSAIMRCGPHPNGSRKATRNNSRHYIYTVLY